MSEYVEPELAVVIPVLYSLGNIIKKIDRIHNKYIPLIITGISILLCQIYVIGENGISGSGIFSGIVQGILCASICVYGNQIYKQTNIKTE